MTVQKFSKSLSENYGFLLNVYNSLRLTGTWPYSGFSNEFGIFYAYHSFGSAHRLKRLAIGNVRSNRTMQTSLWFGHLQFKRGCIFKRLYLTLRGNTTDSKLTFTDCIQSSHASHGVNVFLGILLYLPWFNVTWVRSLSCLPYSAKIHHRWYFVLDVQKILFGLTLYKMFLVMMELPHDLLWVYSARQFCHRISSIRRLSYGSLIW